MSLLKVMALKKLAKLNNFSFKSVEIDGTTFEYEELKDGADIWTIDTEGVVGIPADGEYEIEGSKVKIEGGILKLLPETTIESEETLSEESLEVRIAALEEVVERLLVSDQEFKAMKEKLSKSVVAPDKKVVNQLSKFGL